MDEVTQKQDVFARAFERDEWQGCRAIRLEALHEEPSVFSSNFSAEAAKPDDFWRDTASSENCQMFGLFDDDVIVGCVGIATMRDDTSGESAILWGTYIRAAYRRRGLSGLLYKALIDFAAQKTKWKQIVVSHRASNVPSKMATLEHGFEYTHTESKVWPDGQLEDHLFYKLDLGIIRS
jgi:RimJ/RimL family protein N-acetyltransferase